MHGVIKPLQIGVLTQKVTVDKSHRFETFIAPLFPSLHAIVYSIFNTLRVLNGAIYIYIYFCFSTYHFILVI